MKSNKETQTGNAKPRKSIWDIEEQLGLKKIDGAWAGTYTTGDFDALHDYERGLLYVKISPTMVAHPGVYSIMFSISTIDDGVWQAYDPVADLTKEEAEKRVDEVAKAFLEHMQRSLKLPSEEELNKWLIPMKLWGEYTG
jgi:hypothetical protein